MQLDVVALYYVGLRRADLGVCGIGVQPCPFWVQGIFAVILAIFIYGAVAYWLEARRKRMQ